LKLLGPILITFSGVDGAGKSTVLYEIKARLEKMNYKVIELRSRPQIFPILSFFKYGKKNAEKIATNSLPRTGTNKSKLSSYIRFLYYFFDYFFGQIYITIRHFGSKNIILYDRYYFDYIVDPKRVNINVNSNFIKFFYYFIKKPDLNFFLYAPASDIIKRKKELDEITIISLTERYKFLFNTLNKKKSNHVIVENITLSKTVNTIFKNVNEIL